MHRPLFIFLLALALLTRDAPASAAPAVGATAAVPGTVVAGTPTVVTVTAVLPATPLPSGVNLVRLGADGQGAILGVMHDDGQGGDAVAGDGVYTLQITLNESAAGAVTLEVTAAYLGQLRRAQSPPFTVAVTLPIESVTVTPAQAILTFGQTLQFSAAVLPVTLSQGVTWSVNGKPGGDPTVGTISAAGLYTAPLQNTGIMDVRATSIAVPQLSGDARVTVLDSKAGEAFSPGVSVAPYTGAGTVSLLSLPVSVAPYPGAGTTSLLSLPVSVIRLTGAGAVFVFSPGVSVAPFTAGAGAVYLLSLPVSVIHASPTGVGEELVAAFVASPGVSIKPFEPLTGADTGAIFVVSPGVSVQPTPVKTGAVPQRAKTGTAIIALSPAQVLPGAEDTVTVTGTHLDAARALAFLDDAGHLDTSLSVRSAVVAGDGGTLTLRLSVSPQARPGRRRLMLWTLPK